MSSGYARDSLRATWADRIDRPPLLLLIFARWLLLLGLVNPLLCAVLWACDLLPVEYVALFTVLAVLKAWSGREIMIGLGEWQG